MKAKKTVKFAVVAILIAMIFIVGANTPRVIKEMWKYVTEIDKGYMWIINIAIAAIVAFIVSRVPSRKAKVLSVVSFLLTVILAECIIWHIGEISAILMTTIAKRNWIYVGVGVLASTIAYLVIEKDNGIETTE